MHKDDPADQGTPDVVCVGYGSSSLLVCAPLQLFALYTAAEGELVELRSLVRVVGGSQGELLGEQFAE